MAKRPEGLSPCYASMASPDIPESYTMRWTPHTSQNGATIHLYSSNGSTLLKTYSVSGSTTEVDMGNLGYSFSDGSAYYWTVTVAGVVSVKAKFYYYSVPARPSVIWGHTPQPGDVIVSDTYFAEIKTNVKNVMNDYDGAPSSLLSALDRLFTDEVVPSRDDFSTLENVVAYLSTQLENYYSIDIDGPVEDSLGITDLERIRQHIDRVINVNPQPVQSIKIEVAAPSMYSVSGMNAVHTENKDSTIDLSWNVGAVPSYSGKFIFEKLSPSKDIRYYECRFEYGPSNAPFTSLLFYKDGQIVDGTYHTFDTNWDGLYTSTTLGLAKQSLQITAVDQRGNRSAPRSVNKTYGSNFKAPLGVKHFELQYQRAPLSDSYVDKNGKFSSTWTTKNTSYTHKISGAEGRIYYRVRAVDLSGLTTDWSYDNGITWDPLTPPAAPSKFWADNISTQQMGLYWKPAARAEYYEVYRWITPGTKIYEGTNSTGGCWATGLSSNSSYNFYVRAVNRVGVSPWVSLTARTKASRATKTTKATTGKSWNSGYKSVRTGRTIANSHWRSDTLVYQGEWKEIYGSPNYIGPPGQTWGKHKGMWIFDDNWWRSTLSGKKIIKVEMWIQRKGAAHGYYNDQTPTFWLHNYDTFPNGQPSFFGKFHPGKDFDLGESGWVTLPNWYGEYIRDNKARGIGIYRDNWERLPYIKFYANAQLRITYE
jgi:hypothetical protein